MSRGVGEHNIQIALSPQAVKSVLQAYLLQVVRGYNLTGRNDLDDQTLRLYLNAAATEISHRTGRPCSILDEATLNYKRPQLHPDLRDIIQQRANWKEPARQKKQPVTLRMIEAISERTHDLAAEYTPLIAFLSREYAVYDWERIVIFTGSRIAEYGQSSSATTQRRSAKAAASKRYAVVPTSAVTSHWSGSPIAFIASDITLWDAHMCQLDHSVCLQPEAHSTICEVHIRFRFDKSKTNFSIRKFRRQRDIKFDLIVGVINVFRRASALRLPANEPLAQYRQINGAIVCLRDRDVKQVLRDACVRAYPDPTHYCRLHIDGLVSHSNRVTAALCLLLGGATIEEIAFRLRWEKGSVPTYLRECFVGIDTIMQKAIAGAYLTK